MGEYITLIIFCSNQAGMGEVANPMEGDKEIQITVPLPPPEPPTPVDLNQSNISETSLDTSIKEEESPEDSKIKLITHKSVRAKIISII